MIGGLFDPESGFSIRRHCRPHWDQAGAVVFITFRTADSIPKKVIQLWDIQKNRWLKEHGVGEQGHWSQILQTVSAELQIEFRKKFDRQREVFLDDCNGECVLQRPELAKIVHDALLFFDGDRYLMGNFIVMPNHVHLLCVFLSKDALVKQCDSWLHFTAREINQVLKRKGKFWQQEPFDHLVRSSAQYEYLRKYIAENGTKAGLNKNQFLYREYRE